MCKGRSDASQHLKVAESLATELALLAEIYTRCDPLKVYDGKQARPR